MVRTRIRAIFALILFTVSLNVSAQEIPGISSPVTITISPELPRPGQMVSLYLQSFSIDLDKSSITWTVDGRMILRGTGARSASTEAGNLGTIKNVVATISTTEGDFTVNGRVAPGELSLIWEAATYVPPFYKGKALHSHGGLYKVTAIPALYSSSGAMYDPRTLTYTWRKNGATDTIYSGYGKSSYTGSQTSFIRQGDEITVEISSGDGLVSASKSIIISPVSPETRIYEDSPLYGIRYERAFSENVFLLNEEISLAAEPYFFSAKDKSSSVLSFDWAVNEQPVPEFSKKSSITLRKPAGASGAAQIGVSIGNSVKLLQSANHNLVLRYE